ncbi:MAG TPA: DinB family protein [Gammaproteobacteria bacterium]|nr:DinB family protein [Gammaproteobacteria bacterium]
MRLHQYFTAFAGYHIWAHGRLLHALKPMTDADYHADQGLFFRSVHRTLNHLLLVDLLWQGRLTAKSFLISGLDQELVKERARLAEEMLRQAAALQGLVKGLDERSFDMPNPYVDTEGVAREYPLALQLAHAFNHATHHRGQVTAVITRLGLVSPVLDLPDFLSDQPPAS